VKVAVQLNDNTDLENRGTGLLSFLKPIRSGSSTTGINIVAAPVAANFCVFGAVNTYTGSTVINGSIVTGTSAAATYYGRLRTTVSGALPSTTTLDITGNTTGGYLDLYGTVQTVKQLSSSGTNPALARISNTAASAATLAVSSTAVDSVFGGVISDGAGVVGLTKSGAGTRLTLTAAQTYTGATVVSGGVLRVNGSLGATPVTIEGGTLEGTGDGVTSGLIGGAVRVGNGLLASGLRDARLAPGNSVGTLAVASASFAEDGALAIEISDAGAGLSDGGCDLLLVGGALDLRGAALELSTTGALNDSAYIVARYGSLVGEFASVSGLPAGYTLDYHYEGNQIALLVPEPGALGLLAGGFLLLRRRRG
jgi:autotransporter-associated beta strand protein